MHYLYILQMSDGRLYVGVTDNLYRRQSQHGKDPATRTTNVFGAGPILYHEEFLDRVIALKRERQVKKWSHGKKLALVQRDKTELKRLAKRRKF